MQLEAFQAPLFKQIRSGHYAPQFAAIEALTPDVASIDLGDCVTIQTRSGEDYEALARSLMPWRKGPFKINNLLIDSEWRSFVKYNLLLPHLDLAGKRVLDVGCNNGYYLFRMLSLKPESLTGFDPSALFYLQFLFIDRFVRSRIRYELLGVQHLPEYGQRFDTVFCLGVLYHRPDPIGTLKALSSALEKGGELILDTFMIEGGEEYCLSPKARYSKIPNIWFIPTVPALFNWLERTGFEAMRVLEKKPTDASEQRKTAWIEGESLEHFLDPGDPGKTVEGYPAPVRVYISARRR
ncbi:MAG: tRNA 5-methoxyuridine(34)/uridine 5-oxyacetic acid(34) synthase CmoB [Campylobacterales bacterium]